MHRPFALSIIAAALITLIPAAHADGIINAMTHAPLPRELTVEVRPFDDSDSNLQIKAEFESVLRASGIKTAEGAPYIMNFEVRDRLGQLTTAGNRHILSFESRGGQGGGENAKARVNVFDSRDGGLLNKGVGDSRVSTRTVYQLNVDIESRANGKRLWDAWAEAQLSGGDGSDLARRMVPVIVNNIGKTIKRAEFQVY